MRIVDLSQDNKQTYFLCLENYSEEMQEAIAAKENWYNEMKNKGLRVKMAEDDDGDIGGMIQYFPVEQSWIEGSDLYFISCIWVHSKKDGVKNFQNKGMGKALLKAAEEDVKRLGKKGIVAWGTSLPVWMKASWYKKQGFEPVDKKGLFGDVLLWKTFEDNVLPPKWIKPKKKPETSKEKVKITCMSNGWCSAMNMSCHLTKEVASEFGDQVEVEEVNTSDRKTFDEWGTSDAIYIDGKKISAGPPPSKKELRKIIEKKIKRKN